MQITESMLAPVRRRFGDADEALPVQRLNDLYNEAAHGILPLFDKRLPDSHWKEFLRKNGMRQTGNQIFGSTDWIDSSIGGFALVLAFVDRVPRLTEEYSWRALAHCHGGVRVNWVNAIAIELTPNPEMTAKLKSIVDRWHLSYLCDPALILPSHRAEAEARVREYHAQLDGLGVHWTGSMPSPQDALYPIDGTQEALNRLALDPPQLGAVTQPSGSEEPIMPVILVLSENSD